jgi:lysophospholipase L1-like esterase
MKYLAFALLFVSPFASAGVHQRCVIAGDSIQAYVYAPGASQADASKLTASLIPTLTNVSITNVSSAGQRMASGGVAGYGLVSNLQSLWFVQGGRPADCIIITLGTNDWSAPFVGAMEFITAYRNAIRYSKTQGMTVICVPPLWRGNEGALVAKPDGSWTIAQFRYFAMNVCYEEGAKVFDASQIGLTPAHYAETGAAALHLNASGHEVFAAALVAKMQAWGLWQ